MYSMKLEWKEFNVDLKTMDTWLKEQSEDYKGNSADIALTLWFENEPSEEIKEVIQDKWDSLDEESDEVLSYISKEDAAIEQATISAALTASAKAKLLAVGLTEEEADTLVG